MEDRFQYILQPIARRSAIVKLTMGALAVSYAQSGLALAAGEPGKSGRLASQPLSGSAPTDGERFEQRSAILPPTPTLPPPKVSGLIPANGTQLFCQEFGSGPPMLFLHGGMASSEYWGNQVRYFASRFRCILLDTRSHGRSLPSPAPPSYSLYADDVVRVLDFLRLERTVVVGWSDGAITGLLLAIRHPGRISGLFAFGANYSLSGSRPGGSANPTFRAFAARCASEYQHLSPAPAAFPQTLAGLRHMWATEPNIEPAQLQTIRTPVTIADGEHDEIISLDHTRRLASLIPRARLVIEPGVGHFAILETPDQFNRDLDQFIKTLG